MIKILYSDKFLVVCEKPVNLLSEQQAGAHNTLPEQLKKMTGAYRIDTLHRLDKMVGGCMVYSRSDKATKPLSHDIKEHRIVKEYLAVVHGKIEPTSGEMRDFLFKDAKNCKSYVVKTLRKGAKEALLEYQVLGSAKTQKGEEVSLVKVRLHTGRTHQIRVQFSSRKHPLLGDGKYGSHDNGCFVALWSYHLAFSHPVFRGKTVDEISLPPKNDYPWKLFKAEISALKPLENKSQKENDDYGTEKGIS